MFYTLFVLVFFLLPSYFFGGAISDAQESSQTNTECRGLPKSERFSAVGLELGMCIDEVKQTLSKHNAILTDESSGDTINEKFYNTKYIGSPPPQKENIVASWMFVSFYKDVLYHVLANFYYEEVAYCKVSFKTLESVLSKKYGPGIYNKTFQLTGKTYPYSKVWITDKNAIGLSINSKYPESLVLTYSNNNLLKLLNEEREKKEMEEYGEGF